MFKIPELELNPHKIYKMPEQLFVKSFEKNYLVIARDSANWVLLNNNRQLEIFNYLLEGNCVMDLFNSFPDNAKNDIYEVLVELEAKRFENMTVQHPQEHGMYMYLTNRCNQICRHCYMSAGEGVIQELSTEEIKAILKSFSQYGGKVVTFTGGEATLRSDFIDIVLFAKSIELKVCVLSNGLLWTQTLVDSVKKSVDEVQISIDGFDAASYKHVRGVDTFDTALTAVDRLLKADIRVIVAITPLLETLLDNKEKYAEFAKSLIFKYRGRDFLVKFNTELMEGRNIVPTENENEQYRAAIRSIKAECAPYSEEEGFALNHINSTVFNNCGYGGLCIAANGDTYFCSIIAKCAKQANIRIHSFESIMSQSQKARELSDVNNLVPCKDCELKFLCGGGCRVKYFTKLAEEVIGDVQTTHHYIREVPCTENHKTKFYRLMVNANRLFYR